jgi:hypothetical protein
LLNHFDEVEFDKLDLKVDSYGSFIANETVKEKFNLAVAQAAWKFERIDRGFAHPEYIFDHNVETAEEEDCYKVMNDSKNSHTFLSAVIYFNRLPWNNEVRRVMERVQAFRVKRYCKRTDLIQKSWVGQSIGTRIGRLLGEKTFENRDPTFNRRILKSIKQGLTRDEVSIMKGSGLLEKFDGRYLDLTEA